MEIKFKIALSFMLGAATTVGAALIAFSVPHVKETPVPKEGEKYLFDNRSTEINPFTSDTVEISRVSRGFVEYSIKCIKWELENNPETLLDSLFAGAEVSEIRKYSISIEEFNKHSIKL